MIIKGKSRTGASGLGKYLASTEVNERAVHVETRGTVARDLCGALIEMEAYSAATKCEKPLYHGVISPEPPHRLTADQRTEAIDVLEKELGLVGHARIVVVHEKLGREHIHAVWSRIDLERMRSVSDSHNYRKHEIAARELERRFGHDRVQGVHHERDGIKRPDRTPSRSELRQEERTGIKGKDVKREVTELFRNSDNGDAFKAALEHRGYTLARGNHRDFVIIDRAGGVHSLPRRIEGMKVAELRAFMSPIDSNSLPTVDQLREETAERQSQQGDARRDALKQRDYSAGDDYVNQSSAALRDHKRRQAILDQWKDRRTSEVFKPSTERLPPRELPRHARGNSQDGDPNQQTRAPGGGHTRSR